jgi:hypothetical protein
MTTLAMMTCAGMTNGKTGEVIPFVISQAKPAWASITALVMRQMRAEWMPRA